MSEGVADQGKVAAFAADQLVPALRKAEWWGPELVVCDYCRGLVLPGERKSMEPMAARLDPDHAQAKHASIQRFITDSVWDYRVILNAASDYAMPFLLSRGMLEAWILDDTGLPKRGNCSVGVGTQYCGERGMTINCQVVVTINLANHFASLPSAYRLFLPRAWIDDPVRRERVGVPVDLTFKSKPEIALELLDDLLEHHTDLAPVLADAGYGDSGQFRRALIERGLQYMVGIRSSILVWPNGTGPLPPPPPKPGRGKKPKRWRRNPKQLPCTVVEVARTLPSEAWATVEWREGTKGPMCSRFAACRVKVPGNRNSNDTYGWIHPEQWLLVEWPEKEPSPVRYWLSTLSPTASLSALVNLAKLRWRVERDYEELKGELGLGHFEGRTWAGFHHHGACVLATYAFLVTERTRIFPPTLREFLGSPEPPFPEARSWRTLARQARTS